MCNTNFTPNSPRQSTCSGVCKKALRKQWNDTNNALTADAKRNANAVQYADIADIPTCVICGYKSTSLQSHLKSHKLSVPQYREQYGVTNEQIFHSSYTQRKSEHMTGNKNPGYQHGGKMSSFSKNNTKYDGMSDEEKQQAIVAQVNKANTTKRNNSSYSTTIEYYTTRGFSHEEATELVKQRQRTFTLEKCIEKYGEKDGYKRWLDRQQKWLKTLAALPIGEKERIARAKTLALVNSYSKISKDLFVEILEKKPEAQLTAKYGTDELIIHMSTGHIRPDFVIGNKIIEFNGDFWHANPSLYAPNDELRFPGGRGQMKIVTASSIWEKDSERISALCGRGYDVLVVWEHDYKKDKEGTIQKCLDFLNS